MVTLTDSDVVLDDRVLRALDARARRGIMRVLLAQALMGVFAGVVSLGVAGFPAGASALVGAGAYLVPNALFALRLLAGLSGIRKGGAISFLMGQLLKLGSAGLILFVVAWFWRDDLVWPALLFGLVCTLKGYVLLLFFRKLP